MAAKKRAEFGEGLIIRPAIRPAVAREKSLIHSRAETVRSELRALRNEALSDGSMSVLVSPTRLVEPDLVCMSLGYFGAFDSQCGYQSGYREKCGSPKPPQSIVGNWLPTLDTLRNFLQLSSLT
jgi:hypothetical protein